jgi:hypothetical protein
MPCRCNGGEEPDISEVITEENETAIGLKQTLQLQALRSDFEPQRRKAQGGGGQISSRIWLRTGGLIRAQKFGFFKRKSPLRLVDSYERPISTRLT